MQPALLIRLRPSGPWRCGPGEGEDDPTGQDSLYRSDRLYSAITLAMRDLGFLNEWLDRTARASTPAVTFTSLFPWQAETLFVIPPLTLWPPPPTSVTSGSPVFLSKLRWNAARFVPLTLIESLLAGRTVVAEQWSPDPESGCLLRRDRPSVSPFRFAIRKTAAVDRATNSAVHLDARGCIEFEPGSGLWTVARFADEAASNNWNDRVKSAFRLTAETGFGGRRKSGWGHAASPEFQNGDWPNILLPKLRAGSSNGGSAGSAEKSLYWLLSLYSPSPGDAIDWASGSYEVIARGGRVESVPPSGERKKTVRMVCEGSVLRAQSEPAGAAVNVAPDGFRHPVYRSGLAITVALPENGLQTEQDFAETQIVEQPADEDLEARPCTEPPATPAEDSAPVVQPEEPADAV